VIVSTMLTAPNYLILSSTQNHSSSLTIMFVLSSAVSQVAAMNSPAAFNKAATPR
jgi:hypothetical protein